MIWLALYLAIGLAIALGFIVSCHVEGIPLSTSDKTKTLVLGTLGWPGIVILALWDLLSKDPRDKWG